ncbi:MAG: acyltransferase domain-containing protein [Asgard group archaeon]|nr:acyltransferase domain-containing protein [Asgard group archaeon]
MKREYTFDNILKTKKPIFAYNPPGLLKVDLIQAVIAAGGVGLIDLERLSLPESEQLIRKCYQDLLGLWGVRIASEDQLKLLMELHNYNFPVLVILSDVQLSKKTINQLKERPFIVLAEVTTLEEAYNQKWVDVYLVKGNEAAGRVGDETSFILSQQFADAGLPFIVQGGIGLYTAPAVFGVGAKGVVLDSQLYLTKESPLPQKWKEWLSKLDATDSKILGTSTKWNYRVYAKLGTKIVKRIIEEEKELLPLSIEERSSTFKDKILSHREMFDSKDLTESLLPLGQDIAFAKTLTEKFPTVKEIIDGIINQIKQQIIFAKTHYPFSEKSEFANELGIKYPIAQGPMANVSENPLFAKEIAKNGALPFLALGSLFENQTLKLIRETQKELTSKPFGCGIIGLEANKKARDVHLKLLQELKPPFVVVAAGTIEQAKEVMNYNIKTFLHTPSAAIFKEAIETKVDYLVLEGMECGGHIGVLTSFVLWELSLYEIAKLRAVLQKEKRKVKIAFAGGIGDRYSAAMVGVIASAIPDLTMSLMWVGSAYITVKEIVETQAIKPLYQQLALDAKETRVLGETVNTRARSIPTPFTEIIVQHELDRLKEGMGLSERKHLFERDNLGATRIAALGQIWNPNGEDDKPNRFMSIDEKGQFEKGNYLIGQIVASLRSVRTIENLHQELVALSQGVIEKKSHEIISNLDEINDLMTNEQRNEQPTLEITNPLRVNQHFEIEGEGVAIVGLGGVFPDALNISDFWRNIINKVYSIKEISQERWGSDIKIFYSEDKNIPDKTYCKIAATIDNFKFNSLEFKIPPQMAISIDRVQKIALVAAKEALADAGLLGDEVDNTRTAVIVGNSMGGESRIEHTRKVYIPEFIATVESSQEFAKIDRNIWSRIKEQIITDYDKRLLPINEDSMPGELSNVISGRIANIFNLRGKNMTTDAACASSLAALNVAVKGLLDNECDVALCGGADCSLDPTTFVKFSKIGALSADGSFPFDKRAGGFVMGEGAGFIVLKRLSDAIKTGEKIYAVIRGLGASSDGKGKGITAPNPLGQKLAVERALEQAKLTLKDIQLIEAHGTSTKVGDVVELEVLNSLGKDIPKHSIAIGSIKSQIGHLKSAAGIASIIKAALALHHKILPPSINFDTPNPNIEWQNSPYYVNTELKDWQKSTKQPRFVGVSSFGFGGTNYHTILEEYVPNQTKGHLPRVMTPEEISEIMNNLGSLSIVPTTKEMIFDSEAWKNYIATNLSLETEPIFFGADTKEKLQTQMLEFVKAIPSNNFEVQGTGKRIRELCYESLSEIKKDNKIGIVCKSFAELDQLIKGALDGLENKSKRLLLRNKGIFYSDDFKVNKIAFLFPGQGSQYVRMGKELYDKYQIVRDTFHEADIITMELMNFKITEAIFALGKSDEEANEALRQTEITQPAIFVVNIAIFRLLQSYGIKPDFVAGHSLGEYSALVASGILSFRDGLRAVIPRGQAMAKFDTKDKGIMASVAAGFDEVDKILAQVDGYVIAANKNSHSQTVISGATIAVKKAMELFTAKGINVVPIPVSAAFHSQIVAPAVSDLRVSLEKLTYNKMEIPISSNVTGDIYPETREEIIALLCEQIASPVEWVKQIENMYENYGVRTFIEVGPKYVLTSFAKGILENKDDILTLASNHPKRGELQHFSEVLTALSVFSYAVQYPKLDDNIFADTFLSPTKQFYKERIVAIEIPTPISEQIRIDSNSPFSSLIDGELGSIITDPNFNDYLELQKPAISAFLKAGFETYRDKIATAMKTHDRFEKLGLTTESIGVSGISLGLPGKKRSVFDPNNFDDILAGENFIEEIPETIRDKMVDKNIVRLVKDAIKGAQFQTITDAAEVIKLAAQKGKFNLAEEYGVDADFVEILDITFQLAFAAGIEALRDAGIPLMPLKVQTSVGKEITKGWALPEPLRDETGIVFASAFPAYSNLISTISQYLTDKFENKHQQEIMSIFNDLISQIKDPSAKQKIEQWLEHNKADLESNKDSQFEFSRKFLFEVLSMGHSQFAQFIRARGPNTQVNAACSSTTQAISIAEDWIRTGRCKRVIVVAADDVTNEQMLEWIGSGFLAVGAATTKADVKEAALPFDKRRHGMIIGMGAVGIVLESEQAIKERGVKPIVDLLGTHIVNSAFHGTRLDRDHISSQMNEFITTIEKRFGLNRNEIAKQLVFVSHETYTPARGGSASAEIDALRKTFGTGIDNIIIANTKGFTGHAMGAGIEDAVAIKILEKGIVPPVANWKEEDPELGHLNLSKGGPANVKYALRFAAGFGSQLTLALFRLNTKDNRFTSQAYEDWLHSLGGSRGTLEVVNKTLRLNEDTSIISKAKTSSSISQPSAITADTQIVKVIVDLISEKTGYPVDMIEPNMRLEEDLGIDTVKQAELFGLLRNKYNLPREEGVRIQDYYSVNKIAEYLSSKMGNAGVKSVEQQVSASLTTDSDKALIIKQITSLISEKTGYPEEMVEPDMELEEDLGIDTVKQAEMFGIIRSKWDLPREEGIRIQDYSTVNKIADYIQNRISTSKPTSQAKTDLGAIDESIKIVPAQRSIVKIIDAPQFPSEKLSLANKHFIIAGEISDFTNELIQLLEKKKVIINSIIDVRKLKTIDALTKAIPHEAIDGLLFIAPKTSKNTIHDYSPKAFFALCKNCNFNQNPTIFTIIPDQLLFGWNDKKSKPIVGSLTGLTKTVAREFSGSNIKTISCIKPDQTMGELLFNDGFIEIAYDEKDLRKAFIVQPMPIDNTPSEKFTPTKDDLILITGGAQGITLEITKEIANNYHSNLALVGRTILPKNIDELMSYDDTQLASLKEELIEKLKSTDEKVTPVKIEKEWSKTTKAITIKRNLLELEQLGSKVNYYSGDVVNSDRMQEILSKIRSDFKSDITGFVHGAGLEISKLIADKSQDDFNLIYDVKAIGFDNIIENVDLSKLNFVICFGSVAGRFGNAGQTDYSAANDYLAKYCWYLRSKGIRATTICWTAWADIGMATRGSVLKILQYAGVTPISTSDGVKAFISELEFGQEPEVVIAGNLGLLLNSPNGFAVVDKRKHPLLDKVKRNYDGSIIMEREFSLDTDLYLDHHRFENIPYLPGVIGLELFYELANIVYPKNNIFSFNDVEFSSAVKFKNEESRKLRLVMDYSSNPAVILESDIIKDNKVIGLPTKHFKATIEFGKPLSKLESIPKINSKSAIKDKAIYSILPHGSRFQVLNEIDSNEDEIYGKIAQIAENQLSYNSKSFYANPLAIESAFQAAGLLDILKDEKLGLPLGIESLKYYKTSNLPLFVISTKKGEGEFGSIYDFEIITDKGELVLEAKNYKTAQVNFGINLDPVKEIKKEQLKQLFHLPKTTIIEITSTHELEGQLSTAQIKLDELLCSEELSKWQSFKVEKRKIEWLAGVLTAKKAVQQLYPKIDYKDILIEKTEFGKPIAMIPNRKTPLKVSITHSNGFAVAIADSKINTGIDLEKIESRSKSIVDEMLSNEEKETIEQHSPGEITDELITKIWTAKEAATKVLGTGLNIDLRDLILKKIKKEEMTFEIDVDKLPKSSFEVTKKAINGDSQLILIAKLAKNGDFVAAVCQLS